MLNSTDDPHPRAPVDAEDARDTELLARVARDDVAAFEALYKRYYRKLQRFVVRALGRADGADEIINDVMYVVWQKAETYNGLSRPSTWIFGIAYNKIRKHFENAQRANALNDLAPLFEPWDEGWHEQLELLDLLNNAFDTLSPEHRLVIELTYYHGMHYREIGEVMGCPENTVKTRMFHARRNLARLLEQELGGR